MATEAFTSGDLISRYFERVLGLRQVESPLDCDVRDSAPGAVRRVCLLIEVGTDSDTPSIREMGARLLDAIRNEWLKHSVDELPDIQWIRTDETTWKDAVNDLGSKLTLAIVCGVHVSPQPDPNVVFVPGFTEMQSSHVLKREAWRAMQLKIASAVH